MWERIGVRDTDARVRQRSNSDTKLFQEIDEEKHSKLVRSEFI